MNASNRKQVADRLLAVADRVEDASISSMSQDEITAEVKAVRRERKQRRAANEDSGIKDS